jgi:hypothetical protein
MALHPIALNQWDNSLPPNALSHFRIPTAHFPKKCELAFSPPIFPHFRSRNHPLQNTLQRYRHLSIQRNKTPYIYRGIFFDPLKETYNDHPNNPHPRPHNARIRFSHSFPYSRGGPTRREAKRSKPFPFSPRFVRPRSPVFLQPQTPNPKPQAPHQHPRRPHSCLSFHSWLNPAFFRARPNWRNRGRHSRKCRPPHTASGRFHALSGDGRETSASQQGEDSG